MSDTIKITVSRRTATIVTSLALGVILGGLWLGSAVADPSTSSVADTPYLLPYDGVLNIDGLPAKGQVKIKFSLYSSLTTNAVQWTETQLVDMRDGRFSVGLGRTTSIDLRILTAERLYLGLAIVEDDGAGGEREVVLDARHQIEPAPHAAWTANAADLVVRGDLDVKGGANFVGAATVDAPPVVSSTLTVRNNAQATIRGDVTVGTSVYSGNQTDLRGALNFNGGLNVSSGAVTFTDDAGAQYALTGVDSVNDERGVELRALTNPGAGDSIFRVLSSGGAQRLRVEHDGEVEMENGLRVTKNTTLGPTTVGNLTVGQLPFTLSATSTRSAGPGDTSDLTLGSRDRRICYLVHVRGIDMEDDDRVNCEVYVTGTIWRLRAQAVKATAMCSARCLSW